MSIPIIFSLTLPQVEALSEPINAYSTCLSEGSNGSGNTQSSSLLLLKACVERVGAYLDLYGSLSPLRRVLCCKAADDEFTGIERELTSLSSQLCLDVGVRHMQQGREAAEAVQQDMASIKEAIQTMGGSGGVSREDMGRVRVYLAQAGGEYADMLSDIRSTLATQNAVASERYEKVRQAQLDMQHSLEQTLAQISRAATFQTTLQVALIGGSGTGKTCLLQRFARNSFMDDSHATIGAAFLKHTVPYSDTGTQVEFSCWDTAGQERYNSLTPMYIKGSAAVLVVLDVTERVSLGYAEGFIKMARGVSQDRFVALVGNKLDIVDPMDGSPGERERGVQYEEGCALAERYGAFYTEVSAKDGRGVRLLYQLVGAGALDVQARAEPGARCVKETDLAMDELFRDLKAHKSGNAPSKEDTTSSSASGYSSIDLSQLHFAPPIPPKGLAAYPGHHSGWLTKRGSFIKNWKRRWFTISKSDPLVRYYVEEGDASSRGVISLPPNAELAVAPAGPHSMDMACIRIITPPRTWYLLTEQGHLAAWVQAIEAHMERGA
ncbi:Ran GTPase [Kipferlia bialata]|uniref:Ran GTPase n=1 Tax=Kipferlia bialata TaxID=797122 RepID=A0A9K3CUW4_9EUKA|nr:Ran GTPase [Kipferlia bialata]|eukprot:g5123.t1